MPDERVGKLLAAAGVASRRGADTLIAAGRVTLDGRVATLGEKADPARSVIAVDGRAVDVSGSAALPAVHLAMHKPAGITATVAVEVWIRPLDSVTGMRCTRCTPASNLRRL